MTEYEDLPIGNKTITFSPEDYTDIGEAPVVSLQVKKDTVNLTTEDSKKLTINKVDSENVIADPFNLKLEEEVTEEPNCLHPCGCTDPMFEQEQNGQYFLVDNLFSEIIDDYQRKIARQNLGISDAYALIWGNIKGNLQHQQDLVKFVNQVAISHTTQSFNQLNKKIDSIHTELTDALNTKANTFSPELLGEPKSTTPEVLDQSTRIATTEWVVAKLSSITEDNNLKSIHVTPESIIHGDSNQSVKVNWEYIQPVESQEINGVSLSINARSYTFNNVSEPLTIILNYTLQGVKYTKTILVTAKLPIYFGNAPATNLMSKTVNEEFKAVCNKGDYLYLLVPGLETRVSINGFIGGLRVEGVREMFGVQYNIFKSINHSLGTLNVKVLW